MKVVEGSKSTRLEHSGIRFIDNRWQEPGKMEISSAAKWLCKVVGFSEAECTSQSLSSRSHCCVFRIANQNWGGNDFCDLRFIKHRDTMGALASILRNPVLPIAVKQIEKSCEGELTRSGTFFARPRLPRSHTDTDVSHLTVMRLEMQSASLCRWCWAKADNLW